MDLELPRKSYKWQGSLEALGCQLIPRYSLPWLTSSPSKATQNKQHPADAWEPMLCVVPRWCTRFSLFI